MVKVPYEIHGMEYGNCNCAYGCPCQFNALPTNGNCQYVLFTKIDRGHYGETSLDGLKFVLFGSFPEAVHKGNGTQQLVIDATATEAQREAIQHIAYNEDTDDLTCHYAIYNAMSTTVHDPVVSPIEFEIDMEGRTAKGRVEGLIESSAEPIRNATTGAEHRAQIVLPNGFEYTVAEMGSGTSTTQSPIPLQFSDTYAQFNELHLNQDGVIR